MKFKFNVGTFNLRSLRCEIRKKQLIKDLENYKIDILCLQETKIQNGADNNINGHRLICFDSKSPHYGCGFIISKQCVDSIIRVWKVSDRICVIELRQTDNNKQGKNCTVSIINVYAPTSQRAKQYPDEAEQFYKDLRDTVKEIGNKSVLLIAGDFNAKVGKRLDDDKCLGAYSKGKRNDNGQQLIEFCEDQKLFIANSAFDHPSRHQTTWTGQRQDVHGNIINIYNQIDFIICRQRHKNFITNARSYGGTLLTSDHKLVKTSLNIDIYKQHRERNTKESTQKINIERLSNNKECKAHYQHTLNTALWKTHLNCSPEARWKQTQEAMKHAAQQSVGFVKKGKLNRTQNTEIEKLSEEQKYIRIKIQNSKDSDEIKKLKSKRNKILHSIRTKVTAIRNEELEKKVENIEKSNNASRMFKATKILNQKPLENPKVMDGSTEKLVTNPDDILTIVSNHFETKFHKPDKILISQFLGDPKPLTNPITTTEVRNSINRLNNNRAPGNDEIPSELLKYGTFTLDIIITNILNDTFNNHAPLNINDGVLITLQKPGKRKGPPQNLRPITLLNTIRKTLSTIVLNRIRPAVENYLSESQSGFRPERSTSDVVWTHKWLAAKVNKENININITGIDMSAAFDTIDRHILLDILKTIVEEDELRIIRFLLSNTTINPRIKGATIKKTFQSNVGTPQGDCLSPVLFIIYLEHALKELRLVTPEPKSTLSLITPREVAYADDIDFIGENEIEIKKVQQTLQKFDLQVNVDKTELTKLSRFREEWKTTRKLGSLMGDKEDIERRKHLSNVALYKLTNIWIRNDKIRLETKLKLYRSLVKSVLLYNCSTWALTKADEAALDAFHRKQLRKVMHIVYPTVISNKNLYIKTGERPLSIDILEQRWRLFGHILRRDTEIPANKAMSAYFTRCGPPFKGRPITTLPITLNQNLETSGKKLRLKSKQDLDGLKNLAQDRQRWATFKCELVKAAEASQSVDKDAKGY